MRTVLTGVEKAKAAGRDMALNLVFALIAATLALVALGFLVAAAFIALSAHYSALIACLILAGIFLAISLLILAVRFAGSGSTAPLAAAEPPPPPTPAVDPLAQLAFEIAYGLARGALSRRSQARRDADRDPR